MTNNVRLSGLPDASEDATADVAAVQGGVTKKFTLDSAAGKRAGTEAGNVPVLDSTGQLPASVVPGGGGGGGAGLPTANKADGKVLKATGAGADDNAWEDDSTRPGAGEIDSISQVAQGLLADEEAVLDAGSSDTKLVGNATLKGIVEDISSDHLYGDWTDATQTNFTTLPASGTLWSIPLLGGDGQMAVVNATYFNAITANIGSGRPNFFGPLSSGLPELTGGSLQGALVILDDSGTRWAIPVSNPEGPDSEAAFRLVGDAWEAVDWRSNLLRLDFARIKSNDARYEVFGSLALHGPTANALRDEVILARADGRSQYALRVGYSTADSRYEVVTAKRDAVFNLQAGEVLISNLAATNSAATGKFFKVDDSDVTKGKFVDAPSGSTPSVVKEEIYGYASGARSTGVTYNLSSGKSFDDYDFIIIEIYEGGARYTSPLFSHQDTIGNNDRMLVFGHTNSEGITIDLRSNTSWEIDSIDSAFYNSAGEGVIHLHGIKFA